MSSPFLITLFSVKILSNKDHWSQQNVKKYTYYEDPKLLMGPKTLATSEGLLYLGEELGLELRWIEFWLDLGLGMHW